MQRLFALILVLSLAIAAPLKGIKVVGADPVLTTLVEIALPVSVGDEIENLDLKAVEKAVLDTGYFETAKARLEDGVLIIEVKPRPKIAAVEIKSEAFPPEKLAALLADRLALTPGVVYNPKKASEAAQLLAQTYREQGFPFTPEVKVETEAGQKGVVIRFVIAEHPPLKRLKVKGVTLLPLRDVESAFKPLLEAKRFAFPLYAQGVRAVGQHYAEKGYRGSGVDLKKSQLEDGLLTVVVRELKVVRVDPDGLPEAPLQAGEVLNYDRLVEAVARLSRELGREVHFRLAPEKEGVAVIFSLGKKTYGVIQEVRIEGATAFPEAELRKLLVLKPGDPFNPQLAQADFERLFAYYQRHGFALVPKPDFAFEKGVYVQRLKEVKIAGYRLEWEGAHRTQDFVILRYLPEPGALFSVPVIRKGIGDLLRLGILAGPPQVRTESTARPDALRVVLGLKEAKTVVIAPALAWSSAQGWSGQVTLSDKNLWGRAHDAGLNLAFTENDAGDNLSVSAHYNVPWLYVDLYDFKKVPTSVSARLYSIPYGNFKLMDGNVDTGWEYTERRTGLGFSVGRPLGPTLSLDAGLEAEWVGTALETLDPPSSSSYTEAQARSLLPKPYANAILGATLNYRDADSLDYPTEGQAASLHAGYGLVFPSSGAVGQFWPLWVNYKTYASEDPEKRSVMALRLAAGIIPGQPPASRYFTLGGSEPELAMLRGYPPRSFSGTRLLSGSLEYRYDFQLTSAVSRTVIGILFLDAGSVWEAGQTPEFHAGYGFGVQLNLGYGALQLPAIRLDYGFSPLHPSGVLHFRIGPVF